MKQYVILIICLVALNTGLVGVFFAKDISEKLKLKNRIKFIRVARVVGVVVALATLVLVYFLDLV